MTAEEHIVAWIESSRPHYDRLLKMSTPPAGPNASRAFDFMSLALDAYREMTRSGDAWAGEHSAATIIGAALALSTWELEQ